MLNDSEGVSIVTSTIRAELIQEIFRNYERQEWERKELILIVNKNNISLNPYIQQAMYDPRISIYRVDQTKNLGECLNFGASQAKYNYIAKFDDDDYYSSDYISEAMQLFLTSNAEIVGKRSCFFFFPHRSKLLLRKTNVRAYQRCNKIAGATIMFHRKVLEHVQFSTKTRIGTDVRFVNDCLKKGYRVYTTSPYNFVAFRRVNRLSHTWKVTDKKLLSSKRALIIDTTNFKKYSNKPLHQLPLPGKRKS